MHKISYYYYTEFPYGIQSKKAYPYEKKEGHISIGFDKASDWGINSIEDFDDMMLELYCEKNN